MKENYAWTFDISAKSLGLNIESGTTYCNGKTAVWRYNRDTETLYIGVSKCHPDEMFVKRFGKEVAEYKLQTSPIVLTKEQLWLLFDLRLVKKRRNLIFGESRHMHEIVYSILNRSDW